VVTGRLEKLKKTTDKKTTGTDMTEKKFTAWRRGENIPEFGITVFSGPLHNLDTITEVSTESQYGPPYSLE
jgi:hypothetical protein